MSKKEDTIQMSVGGLTLDPVTKTPIVILKDTENKLNLPIWIGLLEATAMATEIEGIKMARPMTHDLLRDLNFHQNNLRQNLAKLDEEVAAAQAALARFENPVGR